MTNLEFILHYLKHTTPKDEIDPSEVDHNHHIILQTETPTNKGYSIRFIVSANSDSPNGDALMLELYDYTDCNLYEPGVPVDAHWDVDKMSPYLSVDNRCAQLVYPLDGHDDEWPGEYVISSITGEPVCPYKLLSCEPWLLEEFLG
jgi:hypothetical protein